MDDTQERKPRRRLAAAGLVAVGLLTGGILAGSQIAGAANGSSSSSSNSSSSSASNSSSNDQAQRGMDPSKVKHGPDEQLLTGSNAAKATAAALEEYPGATVIRVETDSGDAVYEAHLQKADGSFVTVLFDKQFNVTGTEDGFGGPGPGGMDGHGGPPPGSDSGSGSGSGSTTN